MRVIYIFRMLFNLFVDYISCLSACSSCISRHYKNSDCLYKTLVVQMPVCKCFIYESGISFHVTQKSVECDVFNKSFLYICFTAHDLKISLIFTQFTVCQVYSLGQLTSTDLVSAKGKTKSQLIDIDLQPRRTMFQYTDY